MTPAEPQARPTLGPEAAAGLPSMRHSLPMLLLRARERVMAEFRPILRAHGITEQQWRVLRALAEDSPLDPTTISARACLMMPSLSRILRDLDRRGLIERKALHNGRRRYQASITDAGDALIAAVTPDATGRYLRIEDAIGARRLHALTDLLERIEGLRLD